MEKKHTGEVSFLEKIQLACHKRICEACRRYEEQSKLIERLLKDKMNVPAPPESEQQSKDLEAKILRRLDGQP